jgi:hypothetical protein
MGNVLTGNFLTEAYGDDVIFDLLSPEVSPLSPAQLARLISRKVVFAFSGDDQPLIISFELE